MLSIHPQDISPRHQYPFHQHQPQLPHRHQHLSQTAPSPLLSASLASTLDGDVDEMPHRLSESPVLRRASLSGSESLSPPPSKLPQEAAVAQALEIARESPDGESDPTVNKILEHALAHAWGKVKAQPDSYVMTRDEFAVFNFFQHRFTGDRLAVAARKRYWDNAHA